MYISSLLNMDLQQTRVLPLDNYKAPTHRSRHRTAQHQNPPERKRGSVRERKEGRNGRTQRRRGGGGAGRRERKRRRGGKETKEGKSECGWKSKSEQDAASATI